MPDDPVEIDRATGVFMKTTKELNENFYNHYNMVQNNCNNKISWYKDIMDKISFIHMDWKVNPNFDVWSTTLVLSIKTDSSRCSSG